MLQNPIVADYDLSQFVNVANITSCSFQVGLVEREWLDTLSTINPDEVTFLDFVDAGKNLGAQLKHEVKIKIEVLN